MDKKDIFVPSFCEDGTIHEPIMDGYPPEQVVPALSLASVRGDTDQPYYVLRGPIRPINILNRLVEIEPIQIPSTRIT